MSRRRHSEEFKRDAVRLVTEPGYTNADAARSLGIYENFLRSWRKKYSDDKNRVKSMSVSEQEELLRLGEQNRRLRMERNIFKKATAFFANEKN